MRELVRELRKRTQTLCYIRRFYTDNNKLCPKSGLSTHPGGGGGEIPPGGRSGLGLAEPWAELVAAGGRPGGAKSGLLGGTGMVEGFPCIHPIVPFKLA